MKNLEGTVIGKGDERSLPIIPGTYPAHVCNVGINEYNESFVYNVTFRIAPEVEKVQINKMTRENGELVQVLDAEGTPQKITASYLTSKEFRGDGVWLTPEPGDEKWKNRKYKAYFESLGIVFEADENGDTVLGQVEENDVLGLPCLIKIAQDEYTDKKTGEPKQAWKVFNVYPWSSGEKIDVEEIKSDVPF